MHSSKSVHASLTGIKPFVQAYLGSIFEFYFSHEVCIQTNKLKKVSAEWSFSFQPMPIKQCICVPYFLPRPIRDHDQRQHSDNVKQVPFSQQFFSFLVLIKLTDTSSIISSDLLVYVVLSVVLSLFTIIG